VRANINNIMMLKFSLPELANAATKIQANFRGHITRKQVQDELKKGEASGDDLAKEMDKLKTVTLRHRSLIGTKRNRVQL
jgi:hypothetical protein